MVTPSSALTLLSSFLESNLCSHTFPSLFPLHDCPAAVFNYCPRPPVAVYLHVRFLDFEQGLLHTNGAVRLDVGQVRDGPEPGSFAGASCCRSIGVLCLSRGFDEKCCACQVVLTKWLFSLSLSPPPPRSRSPLSHRSYNPYNPIYTTFSQGGPLTLSDTYISSHISLRADAIEIASGG